MLPFESVATATDSPRYSPAGSLRKFDTEVKGMSGTPLIVAFCWARAEPATSTTPTHAETRFRFMDVLPCRDLRTLGRRFLRYRPGRGGGARPVGPVLQCAGSCVLRRLWVGAERAGQTRLRISSHDLRGSDAAFAPLLERTDRVERVRPIAATAMSHAGHHEEAGPVVLVLAHLVQDAFVIE